MSKHTKAPVEILEPSLLSAPEVLISNYAWIKKSDLTSSQIDALKSTLTIEIKKVGNYPGEAPGPLLTYTETDTLLGLPREYYQQKRKPHHKVSTSLAITSIPDLPLKGSPRPEQQEALDTIIKHLESGQTGSILRASPGWGKSFFGCLLASKLKLKTLVLVHKQFLMDQWIERINQFIPDARVGRVQSDTFDIEDKDIVLAMIQSVSQREYPPELYTSFGLIITDETHRVSARSFSTVPGKFNPRYRLGLTATPRRKDGAEDVFFWHLGPIVFNAKEQRMNPKVRRVYTDFKLHAYKNLNPRLVTKPLLLRFLCANTKRNETIVDQIILSVKAGRRPIVLSERIEHLKDLQAMLLAKWTDPSPVPSTGLYIGGMKEEEYEKSKAATVMFATAQLLSEGFDHPILDTLFLTTPMSDVEQSSGRILRPCEGKKDPVIVDIRDDLVPYCLNCAESRERLYSKICLKEPSTTASGT
jgi:superfamily II DNA or RNA helicase